MAKDSAVNGRRSSKTGGGPDDDDKVRVVVRVRPFNKSETKEAYANIVHVDSLQGTIRLEHLTDARANPDKVINFW